MAKSNKRPAAGQQSWAQARAKAHGAQVTLWCQLRKVTLKTQLKVVAAGLAVAFAVYCAVKFWPF